MKHTLTLLKFLFILLVISTLFTNCATIIGGSTYYAHVFVQDHPDATIFYKGLNFRNGRSSFKVRRADAARFSFTVKEAGCQEQKFDFRTRAFRTWAFVGTVVGWTGVVNGIPLPWGIAVDLGTGALWKPNIAEKGITKVDYKNFNYDVVYEGCIRGKNEVKPVGKTKTEKLKDLKELFDSKILTRDEFEKEKKKILDSE